MGGALGLLLVFLGGIALAFVGLLPIVYAHIGLVELMKKIGAKLIELSYKHSWLAWFREEPAMNLARWISLTICFVVPVALMLSALWYGPVWFGPAADVSVVCNALRLFYGTAIVYAAGAYIWMSLQMLLGSNDTSDESRHYSPPTGNKQGVTTIKARRAAPSQGQP